MDDFVVVLVKVSSPDDLWSCLQTTFRSFQEVI